MSTGPWRTPSGQAPIAPFRTPQELIDAVIDHIQPDTSEIRTDTGQAGAICLQSVNPGRITPGLLRAFVWSS